MGRLGRISRNEGDLYMKIAKERWRVAQNAEKEWWKKWKLLTSKEFKTVVKEYWGHYLRLVANYLKSQDKILDIGCGPNGMINYIDKGERYGLDPLMDFYLSNFEMPKDVKWRKGIGEEIPFENEYFDVVITTNTLDHSHQPERMLKEIHRVLKKDGLLILTVDCYGPFSQLRRKINEKLGRGGAPHPYTFTFWQVQKLLRKSKFHMRLSCSGVGILGKYVKKRLAREEKKKFTLRETVKRTRGLRARALFLIDGRLGYHATDFLFVVSK